MNRSQFTGLLITGCMTAGCTTTIQPPKEKTMIVHSVFFKLKHESGSTDEAAFLTQGAELEKIPGVENFKVLKETSPKNSFDFGFSMEFADQAAYDGYNNHPEHVRFVQEVWLKEVADFQEIDYTAL